MPVVLEKAWKMIAVAPFSEGSGDGMSPGCPLCPMHLPPPACQGEASFVNEAPSLQQIRRHRGAQKTGVHRGFPPAGPRPRGSLKR